MLKNGQSHLKKSSSVCTGRFLKHVWPFFNIMYEKVKNFTMASNQLTVTYTMGKLP